MNNETIKLNITISTDFKTALWAYAKSQHKRPTEIVRLAVSELLVKEGFLSSMDAGKVVNGGDRFTPRVNAAKTEEEKAEIYETYRALAKHARGLRQMHDDILVGKTDKKTVKKPTKN